MLDLCFFDIKSGMMNLIFILFTVLSHGQALAQTNNPLYLGTTGYNQTCGTYNKTMIALPAIYYPWGVCLGNKSELTLDQDYWTKEAMQKWNTEYAQYKRLRWGRNEVIYIPKGPLFVVSCDTEKHNIIYLKLRNLPGTQWANYRAVDNDRRDFVNFYGIITMNKKEKWMKHHFVNVMIHELGHALGLTHMSEDTTEIMTSHGFGAPCKHHFRTQFCDFRGWDFMRFLLPYDPPTRAKNDVIQQIKGAQRSAVCKGKTYTKGFLGAVCR